MAVLGAENRFPAVSGVNLDPVENIRRSIFEKYLVWFNWSIRSFIKGKGYLFLIIIWLRFL